ncbi:glutathione S-transferase [Trichocladium antarcticum]|uniref:Glutathione S-transferase n=1 Tax=Trichocladium antarcticum TaxID=1450529 RepID=A0AAN6UNB0_9PEZI|nr:glutathione S-transferase [Trichocladium antarcticum]
MSAIDTSLHPSPSGTAAALAAAHSTPQPLTLYGSWFCPFVQRVWMVLEEHQIPYQYVEINPYKKDPAFLALNPRGLVPTVTAEVAGKTRLLYESVVVCEWLDELCSSTAAGNGLRLMPAGEGEEAVFERARCRLWMDHVVTRVVPAFYRLLQAQEGVAEARAGFCAAVRAFAKEMVDSGSGARGPWFLGAEFTLVDVLLAPWARRLFLIDHYKKGGVGIPARGEGGPDEEVWERWERWVQAVGERASVKATWSDDGRYIEAYKRYADNTTQSEVGQATRQGRALP